MKIDTLIAKKGKEKITALTAYDALLAKLINQQGIDITLVGDSLAMVIKGDKNTRSATMNDMIYHGSIVAKQITNSVLIIDMPYKSYDNTKQAITNAKQLINIGADMVKIEGGQSQQLQIVAKLKKNHISVCGHLGLQPQQIIKKEDYKIQGKDKKSANIIFNQAKQLINAGIDLLVLECIPSELAKKITTQLPITTIGIGAGIHCDGQILVITDLLGLGNPPRFAKNFVKQYGDIEKAIAAYINEVKMGQFPENITIK